MGASAEEPGGAAGAAHIPRSRWSGDPHLSRVHLVTRTKKGLPQVTRLGKCNSVVLNKDKEHVIHLWLGAPLPAGFPPGKTSEQLQGPSNQVASEKKQPNDHTHQHLKHSKAYISAKLTLDRPDLSLATFFCLLPAKSELI